jgi:F-type H+-transporting ATPase subunit delta
MARPTSAPRRYAEAAFQLAKRDGTLDAWAEGLAVATQLVTDPRILSFVESPAQPARERLALLDRLLKGRVPEGVAKLAALLVERGRVDSLGAVTREYRRLLDIERGIVEARVTSAAPLTTDETEAVQAWAARTTGRTVELIATVDEALIGGLTVRVGLERLRNQLASGTRAR